MRFGDALHVLPIASQYSKEHGPIDWAVAHEQFSEPLCEVLRAQAFINEVHCFHYDHVKDPAWQAPVSCWHPFHEVGDRVNALLGSRYDKTICFGYDVGQYESRKIGFFTEHFAGDLPIDWDYRLNYGAPDFAYRGQTVKIDKLYRPMLTDYPGVSLLGNQGVLQNLRYAAGAKEVITTRTGAAIMLSLARIPFSIAFFDHDWDFYLPLCHKMTGGIRRLEPPN